MDFQAVREQMAAFLRQQGVDAVCAYPEERRRQRSGPVAAVSLREIGRASCRERVSDDV